MRISANTEGIGPRMDALLRFLPLFEQGASSGEWRGGEHLSDGTFTAPWFQFSEVLAEFVEACYAHGWVMEDFNWPRWEHRVRRYEQPGSLRHARVETLARLLTIYIRRDRIGDGHVAAAVHDGHIAAILRRMRDIRARMG